MLPPHPITEKGRVYLASLDEKGRKLHEMAVEKLGSSYFVEKTHGFRKWAATNAVAAANPAPSPPVKN